MSNGFVTRLLRETCSYLINDYGPIAYSRVISAIVTSIGMLIDVHSREGNTKCRHTFAHAGEIRRMLSTLGP